jgi:hypothetical protein
MLHVTNVILMQYMITQSFRLVHVCHCHSFHIPLYRSLIDNSLGYKQHEIRTHRKHEAIGHYPIDCLICRNMLPDIVPLN